VRKGTRPMHDIHIVFGTPGGVEFPDGTCLGVQGENKAARLVLTLPASMLEGDPYYVVRARLADKTVSTLPITAQKNAEGAYYADGRVYLPLSTSLTCSPTMSLRVLAMTKVGSVDAVQDSTEPAQGLWFHAVDGAGGQALPDTVNRETHFHLLASHSVYEIDALEELYEFPCTTIRKGEKVYLRNMCRIRDNCSAGLVPTLNATYRGCFFLKDLQDVFRMFGGLFLRTPASHREACYENLTLARSNGDAYRIQFLYNDLFGSYVLHVIPNMAADDTRYYYTPKDCTFTVEDYGLYRGGTFSLCAGWVREYYVDVEDGYARQCCFEQSDPPPAFFDSTCTQLERELPESFPAEDFTLLPFMVSLNCPPETWAPAGIYTCYDERHEARLEAGYRRVRFTVRADADAWSDGFQTVVVPTASTLDVYSPNYICKSYPRGEHIGMKYEPLSAYGIKVVEIGGGLITLAKTSEYKLTEDTEFTGSLRRIYVHNTRDYYELDDHAHDYTDEGVVVTQPTCTAQGSRKHTCACGHEKTVDIPALGHDWGEWEVTTEATSEADGVETRTCSRCGETETRSVLYVIEDEDPSMIIPVEDLTSGGEGDGE